MRLIAGIALLCLFIVPAIQAQQDVTFSVLGLFHPKELVIEQGGPQPVSIRVANTTLLLNGEPGHRRLVVRAAADELTVGEVDVSSCTVASRQQGSVRFRLSVPDKIQRIYKGKLTIVAHQGVLTAIVSMNREDAVASIVASEMPFGAPLEALKAQAVATRSFLASGPRHRDFDFCDTTHCQFLRSPDDVIARIRQVVEATSGLVLAWHNQTIPALYSSRCGGKTRSLADVGMNPGSGYPYYSVQCKWCLEHPVQWQSRLNPGVRAPQSSNESARITYARQWGWSALPGSSFTIRHDAGEATIEGRSIGHGLGMCQFGAIGLASSGADFRSILAHYYPNSEVIQMPH